MEGLNICIHADIHGYFINAIKFIISRYRNSERSSSSDN